MDAEETFTVWHREVRTRSEQDSRVEKGESPNIGKEERRRVTEKLSGHAEADELKKGKR